MVTVMGSIPRVPHWRGRKRVVGEVKSLPVKLACCLPPPAMLWLLCLGMAVLLQSISKGAGFPWEGAGGTAVPISPCTQAGKCRQGPGAAGMCSLGTHGERISPTAPWGVPGRSRQGGKGNGSSQGISGGQALPESCGITLDIRMSWLRAAGGAESEWGTPSPGVGHECPVPNPHGFLVPRCFWVHQIGASKSLSSASLPTLQPDTLRSSLRGGYADLWDVPAAGRGTPGHPRAWLTLGRAAELAIRHVGPGQASPAAGRSVPAWPGPNTQRRPPRPGASQVLERSWERIPWLRCGSAHALGDLGPATAKD